jgi:hypothetical protein
VLLDEVVAEAYSASDPAKDLPLEPPFQEVARAWREVAGPSETAVSDFLQQHEPGITPVLRTRLPYAAVVSRILPSS